MQEIEQQSDTVTFSRSLSTAKRSINAAASTGHCAVSVLFPVTITKIFLKEKSKFSLQVKLSSAEMKNEIKNQKLWIQKLIITKTKIVVINNKYIGDDTKSPHPPKTKLC